MKIRNEKTENGFKFTLESSTEELQTIEEVFKKMFQNVPITSPLGLNLGNTFEHLEKMFKVTSNIFSVEQDILQFKDMILNGIDILLKQSKENGDKTQP